MSEQRVTVYEGFILTEGGERVAVGFTANENASDEAISHAFLSALAQQVQIDYVAMGTMPVIEVEHITQPG